MRILQECPACSEIGLADLHHTSSDHDIECECLNCGHYEIRTNPDYDPTPDEVGEPPTTMAESQGDPR